MGNWDPKTSRLNLTWCACSWITAQKKNPQLPFILTAFGVLSTCENHSFCVPRRTHRKWVLLKISVKRFSSVKHETWTSMETENATQSPSVPTQGLLLRHLVFCSSRQLCSLTESRATAVTIHNCNPWEIHFSSPNTYVLPIWINVGVEGTDTWLEPAASAFALRGHNPLNWRSVGVSKHLSIDLQMILNQTGNCYQCPWPIFHAYTFTFLEAGYTPKSPFISMLP